jgi:hypothetical protein
MTPMSATNARRARASILALALVGGSITLASGAACASPDAATGGATAPTSSGGAAAIAP